ncbi:hypothetical protein [Aeoliella mucimassa]|uniref:hypothetical protein n=1 Tax=Aeoliella mucimassa TaxID=2527972 RepID=UPI00119E2E43|nr:hypothetical protein [Aeoliella mucimassa]
MKQNLAFTRFSIRELLLISTIIAAIATLIVTRFPQHYETTDFCKNFSIEQSLDELEKEGIIKQNDDGKPIASQGPYSCVMRCEFGELNTGQIIILRDTVKEAIETAITSSDLDIIGSRHKASIPGSNTQSPSSSTDTFHYRGDGNYGVAISYVFQTDKQTSNVIIIQESLIWSSAARKGS